MRNPELQSRLSGVSAVVAAMLDIANVKTATKYLDHKTTIRATVHGKADCRKKRACIVLSIGDPNYAERQFIKDCKKAGETFPVWRVQLKMLPKKKKNGAQATKTIAEAKGRDEGD